MADWLEEPEEKQEDTDSVVQALADPWGTFANTASATPSQNMIYHAPSYQSQPAAESDKEDYETSKLANPSPAGQQQAEENSSEEDLSPWLGYENQAPKESTAATFAATATPAPAATDTAEDDSYADFKPQALTVPQAPQLPNADDARDQLAHQIASFDPNQYKPSGGRRALAAIAGALTTFGSRSPEAGMRVGEQVLNGPLDRARAAEAQREAGMRQAIENTDAQRRESEQDYQNQVGNYNMQERNITNQARVAEWQALAQQRKAAAQQKLAQVDPHTLGPVDPNNPFGEWQGKNAKGETIRDLEPPPAIQKDPRFIMQQRRTEMQQMTRDGIKLTPQESKFYLINGKLAEPSQHTNINIRENEGGSPGATQQRISDIVAKATLDKQVFIDGWHRIADEDEASALGAPVGSYIKGRETLSPQAFRDRIDKFRTDANVKLNRFGAHLDEQGQLHSSDDGPAQSNSGVGKTFSVARWESANPRGNADAAKQLAISQGYKVVP